MGLAERALLRGAARGAQAVHRAARRGLGRFDVSGHPIEVGEAFTERGPARLLDALNRERGPGAEPMPWLAALVCSSAFDLALHDAYGVLHGVPTYETYNAELHERRPGRTI